MAKLIIVCSDCGKKIGEKNATELLENDISHSYCPKCEQKLRAEIKAFQAAKVFTPAVATM